MNAIQIIELILSLAPQGIQLTTGIMAIIKEIETVVSALPAEHQQAVAKLAVKALIAKP